jgi:putative nucleotidyltransferase with HDIG domain
MPPDNGKTFSTSSLRFGRMLLDIFGGRFAGEEASRWSRLFFLVLTALILSILITPHQQLISTTYKAGDIAGTSVRANQDYLLEDTRLTDRKRKEAESTAPLVYTLNPDAALELRQRLGRILELVREARVSPNLEKKKSLRKQVSEVSGFDVDTGDLESLARLRNERITGEITRLTNRVYDQIIVGNKERFANDLLHGLIVTRGTAGAEVPPQSYQQFLGVDEARLLLETSALQDGGDQHDLAVLKGFLVRMLKPNLVLNREATERKRKEARDTISPVMFQVKRGEIIVREGERIRDDQAQKLALIYQSRSGIGRFFMVLGVFSLTLIMLTFPYRFACKNIRKFNPSSKDILLLTYITLGLFLGLRLSLVVTSAIGGMFPYIHVTDYYYLFPFALGAMLVRILINSEVALVYTSVCALLAGILFENSLVIVIYALMTGIVGAHGVRHCKDRGTIYLAGVKVSVVGIALALSFQILSDSFLTMQTLLCVAFAAAGGIITAALVNATIPLLENLFQYTTDIKLLELSSLNSSILRELMIKAPGTYHHSILVGNLAEGAAEAINANPLLARVSAYYHDIGKISKPLYFIENVAGGDNRHDKLSPSMSALILIAHVKEGVELARQNRLGQSIIDIIRQAHGTSLITFFYQKARTLAGPDGVVDERDYRYPGPKPQTREAGLVMLADCVEAASRTLTDPTPARIQGLVQKIINNIFTDGQLDECELTLKNLHEIAKSFNRILAGIYHQRIDYPEPAGKEKGGGGRISLEDLDREPAADPADQSETSQNGGGDDLKRLGMSRQ